MKKKGVAGMERFGCLHPRIRIMLIIFSEEKLGTTSVKEEGDEGEESASKVLEDLKEKKKKGKTVSSFKPVPRETEVATFRRWSD